MTGTGMRAGAESVTPAQVTASGAMAMGEHRIAAACLVITPFYDTV